MNTPQPDTEALRSDIDVTRRRMDDTIDALGNRMQPRHLLDEFLGYLRRTDNNGTSRLSTMRDKVSHGTDAAVHAVVDTLKQNPLPIALIGAGVAWMIFSNRRHQSDTTYGYETEDEFYAGVRYDPDAHFDRPLEYPPGNAPADISEAGWSDQGGSKLGQVKGALGDKAAAARDKLAHAGEAAREKFGALRNATGEKLASARQRAGELGTRVKSRTGELYSSSRERVATTADQHPIELGLACLAFGIIAGLATPTPNAVNRRIGPAADRLRQRARESGQEYLEKGKRVANAAATAVKEEAQAQGLTPEHLREQASAVADRAKEAGRDTARREGLTGNQPGAGAPPEGNQSGSQINDPTIARPAL